MDNAVGVYYYNLTARSGETPPIKSWYQPHGDQGPFKNIRFAYWSGTEYAPNTNFAWLFIANDGYQYAGSKDSDYFAWAVRPGDVAAAVP